MIQPVSVNFSVYANRQTGYGYVPASDLLKMLSQRFMAQSKIIQVKPDRLDFYFNYGVSKQLPVRMAGYVVPGKSYYLARTRFWPDQITVYASKRVLDSLRFVKTVPINIVNFGDTVIQTVALEKIKGVKMVPDRVRIGLYPDIMTEESIDVPVGSINETRRRRGPRPGYRAGREAHVAHALLPAGTARQGEPEGAVHRLLLEVAQNRPALLHQQRQPATRPDAPATLRHERTVSGHARPFLRRMPTHRAFARMASYHGLPQL